MDTSALVSFVERAFEEDILDAIERYTRIESLSPAFDAAWKEHGAIDDAAALLVEWCRLRSIDGLQIDVVELDGLTPVIFAEIPATKDALDAPTTLIYGHFDKQPPLGAWRDGLGAFTPVRDSDRLYGRGTADDGYATFSAFCALEHLSLSRTEHGRVVVLIEASEESGSPDLERYVAHLGDRIGEVSLIICLDSGCATYDRLWVTTSLRGIIVGTLRVDVLDEGVHSGHAGGIVPSSFRICRELLDRVEDASTGEILLPELQADIPPHRVEEMEQLGATFGAQVAGEFPLVDGAALDGTSTSDRIANGTWRSALEVTGASGLPGIEAAGNVLRPFTAFRLSMRIPPNGDPERATEAIETALTTSVPSGARASFTVEQHAAGWDAPALEPWLEETLRTASTEFFGAPHAFLGIGGSIPFMGILGKRYPKAQFLATGVLGPQSNAHGPNEFLHIPTAKAVTATVALVLATSRSASVAPPR